MSRLPDRAERAFGLHNEKRHVLGVVGVRAVCNVADGERRYVLCGLTGQNGGDPLPHRHPAADGKQGKRLSLFPDKVSARRGVERQPPAPPAVVNFRHDVIVHVIGRGGVHPHPPRGDADGKAALRQDLRLIEAVDAHILPFKAIIEERERIAGDVVIIHTLVFQTRCKKTAEAQGTHKRPSPACSALYGVTRSERFQLGAVRAADGRRILPLLPDLQAE